MASVGALRTFGAPAPLTLGVRPRMTSAEIRFGVRTVSGRSSATWKVWTNGGCASDFYVSCRALGGEVKTSFHESGQWHVSFTKYFYETAFENTKPKPPTRFISKWTRPTEIAPGCTLGLRILVPWSAATNRTTGEADDIIWVPPAPEGWAVEFALVLTAPDCQITDWPCKRSMNSQLVGSFILFSGERVWVIWTVQPFVPPEAPKGSGNFFKERNLKSLLGGSLRSITVAKHDDGSRILYDIPVELGTE